MLIWSGSNEWSALARHMLASNRSTAAPQFYWRFATDSRRLRREGGGERGRWNIAK